MRRITRRMHQRQLQRALDDEDWGTSSPTPAMNPTVPPSPTITPLSPPATTPDKLPVVPPSATPLTEEIPPAIRDRSMTAAIAHLKQQDLESYTCTFSPRCVVTIYFAIALTFLPLGASIIAGTARITSINGYKLYSQNCSDITPSFCFVDFKVDRRIRRPSYLYYHLTNFHQNARDYVKSRSPIQNRGVVPTSFTDVANCDRWLCPEGGTGCTSATNFDPSKIIYPCGLTARLVFNDEFQICKDSDCKSVVSTSKKSIAWPTDTKDKFRPNRNAPEFKEKRSWMYLPNGSTKSANELLDSPDFVVWMRLAAFSSFDKLYAVIDEDLVPDINYKMRIKSQFNVTYFNGEKSFFITSTAWFGTRNAFLGVSYLLVGSIALAIAVVLLFKHVLNPNATSNTDPSVLLREHLARLDLDDASYRK